MKLNNFIVHVLMINKAIQKGPFIGSDVRNGPATFRGGAATKQEQITGRWNRAEKLKQQRLQGLSTNKLALQNVNLA